MRILYTSLLALLVAGCATGGAAGGFPTTQIRPAHDAPEAFVTSEGGVPPRDGTCRSPLTDPRNALQITFVRSRAGVGDYVVPEGQYGARGDELLRVDCRSLKAIGLVPR